MAKFGETLRVERENREITLEEIASATKIGKRYLAALEGERFGELPGGVFNKGYVRAYATFVGLDPERMVEAYVVAESGHSARTAAREQDVLQELARAVEGTRPERPSPLRTWAPVLIALVVVSAGVLGWLRWGGRQPANDVARVQPAAGTESRPSPTPSAPIAESEPIASATDATDAEPADDSGVALAGFADRSVSVPETKPEPVPTETPETTVAITTVPEPTLAPEAKPEVEPLETYRVASEPEPVATDTDEVNLRVTEFGVGTAVQDRTLVGEADRFAAGTTVWFWNRILDGSAGDVVEHVWMHEGRTIATTELNVGGAHWRTQSRKTLYKPGRWSVEARDAAGHVLARSEFVCGDS